MSGLDDNSLMPYGKYKDWPMIEVPAKYLILIFNKEAITKDVGNYIYHHYDEIEERAKMEED